MLRNPDDIDYIIIHCADTPNGVDYNIIDIDGWHKERGFERTSSARQAHREDLCSVGYHAVVYVDGAIAWGRAPDEIGAHAKGYNTRSLGVCLIGRDAYTPLQWDSLNKVVEDWRDMHPIVAIIGHNEINKDKTCPGFDVEAWIDGGRKPLEGHICALKPRSGGVI